MSQPASLAPATRARRWRKWIILGSISIGWKVLVLTLGAAMPRWLLTDGVAELPAEARPYAEQARGIAKGLWSNPIERKALVRVVRVMSVETRPIATASAGAMEGDACGQTARVRAYTYFAIPYSEVRTVCERGVVEYRVFRRKRHRAG